MKEGFPEQVESKSDVNEVSGISDLQKKTENLITFGFGFKLCHKPTYQ